MSTNYSRRELEQLLSRDIDELYVLLAQSDPAHSETLFSVDEARKEGRRTFEALSTPLRQRICIDWQYCGRRTRDEFSDAVTLTAAIADVIITVLGGIPAGTVATLLVKKGLNGFCNCEG